MWYMTASTPKERLLDAVVESALTDGIADKSLRAIAAAAGTSHRMLIHHFGSKEGLLVEVIRAVEARQRDLFAEWRVDPNGPLEELGRAFWSTRHSANKARWRASTARITSTSRPSLEPKW